MYQYVLPPKDRLLKRSTAGKTPSGNAISTFGKGLFDLLLKLNFDMLDTFKIKIYWAFCRD